MLIESIWFDLIYYDRSQLLFPLLDRYPNLRVLQICGNFRSSIWSRFLCLVIIFSLSPAYCNGISILLVVKMLLVLFPCVDDGRGDGFQGAQGPRRRAPHPGEGRRPRGRRSGCRRQFLLSPSSAGCCSSWSGRSTRAKLGAVFTVNISWTGTSPSSSVRRCTCSTCLPKVRRHLRRGLLCAARQFGSSRRCSEWPNWEATSTRWL